MIILKISLPMVAFLSLITGWHMAACAQKEYIMPVEEGWVNADSEAEWSRRSPNFLGVRNLGRQNAWVTYLMFKIPEDASSLQGRNLHLWFINSDDLAERNAGVYTLYGSTLTHWTSTTLNAFNAPAWNFTEFNILDSAEMLDVQIVADPSADDLVYSLEGDFLRFLSDNAGREVTLIITKEGNARTATFHSNRGNHAKGPRIW
jgi:hypothetical protein